MEHLDEILEAINSGQIEYRTAEDGLVATTYMLDDCVVQVSGEDQKEGMEKNIALCRFLHHKDVYVPEVLFVGENPFYAVFERFEGISLHMDY